jgi:hypothetical protein
MQSLIEIQIKGMQIRLHIITVAYILFYVIIQLKGLVYKYRVTGAACRRAYAS